MSQKLSLVFQDPFGNAKKTASQKKSCGKSQKQNSSRESLVGGNRSKVGNRMYGCLLWGGEFHSTSMKIRKHVGGYDHAQHLLIVLELICGLRLELMEKSRDFLWTAEKGTRFFYSKN